MVETGFKPVCTYETMAGDNLLATEVCPKGRKHIGGGEAPVYEKYQIHSPKRGGRNYGNNNKFLSPLRG